MIEPRQSGEAFFAQQGKMDRESKAAQPGIGADIAGGLLAADMLFAGGKRQHIAAAAFGIHCFAGEAARHLPQIFFTRRKEPDIRPAEIEAVADRLPFGRNDVGALGARRLQQAEGNNFRHHRDQQRTLGMGSLGNRAQIADQTEHIGALHHDASRLIVNQRGDVFRRAGRNGRARHRALKRRQIFDRLRIVGMKAAGQDGFWPPGQALRHQHGLSRRGGTVVHRGVGNLHPGQERHLGLKLIKILQRALRDFRLIRRVGGKKFRTLDQMIHRGRNMMAISAGAAEERHRAGRNIARGHACHRAFDIHFALRVRQIELGAGDDGFLRNTGEQGINIGHADLRQHLRPVGRGKRQIAHQSPFTNSVYWSAVISPSVSALSASLMRKNQPSPSGSAFTFAGSSLNAALAATISPLSGA